MAAVIIISGPAERAVNLEIKTPEAADIPPAAVEIPVYCLRFLLIFCAVAAGITNIATVISPPTSFTSRATMRVIAIR